MEAILCSYDPLSGWRVVGPSSGTKICVVVVDGRKLLSIPVAQHVKRGWFCNPRKLVSSWVAHIFKDAK